MHWNAALPCQHAAAAAARTTTICLNTVLDRARPPGTVAGWFLYAGLNAIIKCWLRRGAPLGRRHYSVYVLHATVCVICCEEDCLLPLLQQLQSSVRLYLTQLLPCSSTALLRRGRWICRTWNMTDPKGCKQRHVLKTVASIVMQG